MKEPEPCLRIVPSLPAARGREQDEHSIKLRTPVPSPSDEANVMLQMPTLS
jgi:hypothetical protein